MLKLDEVVIGGGLSALVYAYCRDATLIRVTDNGPPPFDFFEPGTDLANFFMESVAFELRANTNNKVVGIPKLALWERLSYVMSMAGRIPFSDKAHSIRIDDDEKTIYVAGSGASKMKIQYNTLRIFDDTSTSGVEAPTLSDIEDQQSDNFLPPKKFKILDWFNVRSGCRHEYDYLCSGDDFVKEIYFYPSERVDGNHNLKDLVAVSYLTETQLHDSEYSDTYVRFKVLDMMKKSGIRGTRNGRDQKNPERYKYYALRIESAIRDVYPLRKNTIFATKPEKDIIFDNRSVESIIKSTFLMPSYVHKIHEQLVTT